MAVSVLGDGALRFDAILEGSQFKAQINEIEKKLQGLTTTVNKESAAIEGFARKSLTAIGAFASVFGAANLVSDIARVRGEFQALEVAFTTMLGSREKANQLLSQVADFAAKTPFELKDVAGATKQLLAFGIASDDIVSTLRSLGDVSAGIGAPLGDIAYLFGTIKTQGVALTQDVRQFAQRGIPIYEELAKVLGKSTEEIGKLITNGEVGFPQIEAAFKSMTAEGSKFGGLMAAQSKTIIGLQSNLKDAIDRMFNELGQGSEGIIASSIKTATAVVEHYQDIIDIIKVLVISYGTYEAAIILSTGSVKGATVAQFLYNSAVRIGQRVQALFNTTLLANPFALIATALAGVIAYLTIFNDKTNEVRTSADLFADANKRSSDSVAELRGKLVPYLETLKQGNVTEKDRVRIYKEVAAIDQKLVEGIDAKSISYQNLTKNVDNYIEKLRHQINVEANREAITSSIKQENEFKNRIEENDKQLAILEERRKRMQNDPNGRQFVSVVEGQMAPFRRSNEELNNFLKEQQTVTEELGGKLNALTEDKKNLTEENKNTITWLEKEIAKYTELRKNVDASSQQFKNYTNEIEALQNRLNKLLGKDAAKEFIKQQKDLQTGLQQLEQDLQAAESDARRSVLTKEQAEIDRINQRYDDLQRRADQFKAGPGTKIRIDQLRVTELTGSTEKRTVEEFKKAIDEQKVIFDRFEQYKQDVGSTKAKELFADQTKGFQTFIDFLKAEQKKLEFDPSPAGQEKKLLLGQQIVEAERKSNEERQEQQIRAYKEMLDATVTFKEQELAINKKYDDLLKQLAEKATGAELEEKTQLIEDQRQQDLGALKDNLNKQSSLYRALNQDILFQSRDQIKSLSDNLKKALEANSTLPPAFKKQILEFIEQLEDLLEATSKAGKLGKEFIDIGAKVGSIADDMSTLGSAIGDVNAGLGDTVSTLGDIASVAGNAITAIGQFSSGQIIEGIGSTVKAIVGAFQIGKKVRESERQAREEIAAFNTQILSGEVELNELLRERQREQLKLNNLKLQGLREEKKLLEEQRKLIQDQFDAVLKQLQAESAVVGKTTEKFGGFLGIGRKTRAKEITETLAGRSFEDLEALFLKGQLSGKAKELFEILQKIKQEGADIDSLLAENARSFQEAITGTTSDSITDSILQGFAEGKRAAADFSGTFQDLMRDAMLQALKFQALEAPLKAFFEQFATHAGTDDILTQEEIERLKANFNAIITDAGKKFDELQKITGISIGGTGAGGNSLSGAIKGITTEQADLLAGQFGGLRITAIDHLRIATSTLREIQSINDNTAAAVRELKGIAEKLRYYYEIAGVKVL